VKLNTRTISVGCVALFTLFAASTPAQDQAAKSEAAHKSDIARRNATGTKPASASKPNDIVCSTDTACKMGSVPVFASNGGSAKVTDSIISQSGTTVQVAGSVSATGGISTLGALFASGNVNSDANVTAIGTVSASSVGASSVTTDAASGGVFSTMYGAANGVAAVEGSATATGASGFTFGVIGQSASDNGRGVFGSAPGAAGVGVIGETTGATGIGVAGKTLNGEGWAFAATGDASQDRAGGGWIKAAVVVNGTTAPYKIIHCFNSTLPGSMSHTPPCGFNLIEENFGVYWIDFGFEVDDRFWSVSAQAFYNSGIEAGLEAIIANANAADPKYAGNNSTIEVDLYKNGGSTQTTNFTLVVY
jgi:hypothetical protein